MKHFLILLLSFVIVLMLCSWVDPMSQNTYYGTLRGSGQYNGFRVEYYVNDTSHLVVSSSGSLISTDRYTVSGRGRINNFEFPIRFDPDSGFQMDLGNYNWVSYELIPDLTPSHFPFPVWLGFLGFLLLVLVVILLIVKGFAI